MGTIGSMGLVNGSEVMITIYTKKPVRRIFPVKMNVVTIFLDDISSERRLFIPG